MARPGVARRLAGRAALFVGGLVAALLVSEGLLQIGAAYRARGGRPPVVLDDGAHRILCVGDSNTYGIFLDESESYPAQLQRLLPPRVQVVNLGYPGMNTSRLRAELPRMLAEVRPDIVLIQIGANDFWTVPTAVDAAAEGIDLSSWLSTHSRVYRLLFMLWRSRSSPSFSVPRLQQFDLHRTDVVGTVGSAPLHLGWEHYGGVVPDWQAHYPENMAAIVDTVRRHGAQPVLLTYASDLLVYRTVSEMVRQSARDLDVPLIELHDRFLSLCSSAACGALLMPDGHPTAAGYGEVAKLVAEGLADRRADVSSSGSP